MLAVLLALTLFLAWSVVGLAALVALRADVSELRVVLMLNVHPPSFYFVLAGKRYVRYFAKTTVSVHGKYLASLRTAELSRCCSLTGLG